MSGRDNLLDVTVFTVVGYDIFGRVRIAVIAVDRRTISDCLSSNLRSHIRYYSPAIEIMVVQRGNAARSVTADLVSRSIKCFHRLLIPIPIPFADIAIPTT